jgi:hypothetical protein
VLQERVLALRALAVIGPLPRELFREDMRRAIRPSNQTLFFGCKGHRGRSAKALSSRCSLLVYLNEHALATGLLPT